MAIDLEGRQQRGERDIRGLQLFGANPVAEQHIAAIGDALTRCRTLVGERDRLAADIVPLRRNTAVAVHLAVEVVDAQITLIREIGNGRYETIANTVEVPGFDKLAFGASLPTLFAKDERMLLSVSAVARRCTPAIASRTSLSEKEAKLTEADQKVGVAERVVKRTQDEAETFVLDNTPPGHPARDAIRQPRTKRGAKGGKGAGSKGQASSANDVPATTTESPANAPTPAAASKAA